MLLGHTTTDRHAPGSLVVHLLTPQNFEFASLSPPEKNFPVHDDENVNYCTSNTHAPFDTSRRAMKMQSNVRDTTFGVHPTGEWRGVPTVWPRTCVSKGRELQKVVQR